MLLGAKELRELIKPGGIITSLPPMEITYMPRQTLAGTPRTTMTIVAAKDDGWMVVDNSPPNAVNAYPIPATVFAGTLQQCADYVVREMSPPGTVVDA